MACASGSVDSSASLSRPASLSSSDWVYGRVKHSTEACGNGGKLGRYPEGRYPEGRYPEPMPM